MQAAVKKPDRVLSLDVMRGLIMLLLAAESCSVYVSLNNLNLPYALSALTQQFFHHPWHGLRFWDLVQPAFMLMAGSAMYISYYYNTKKGISWQQHFRHIFFRCCKLFICGVALHCIYAGGLVWELWNVLTQLSVTTLIAYLIIRIPAAFQIGFTVFLLGLTTFLYQRVLMPGFDQPYVEHHNFGAWMDTVLMGKINSDGWVAINIVPTAAHTIWGVLAGQLLISALSYNEKIKRLVLAGSACLLLGYGLDLVNAIPIIKRISTASFVLASGGWVLLIMALLYWLTDVKKWNRHAWIFIVVGMNSIFIYLFFETVGVQWVNGAVAIFVKGAAGFAGLSQKLAAVLSAFITLFLEWRLCYWLYKKGIFFKL